MQRHHKMLGAHATGIAPGGFRWNRATTFDRIPRSTTREIRDACDRFLWRDSKPVLPDNSHVTLCSRLKSAKTITG